MTTSSDLTRLAFGRLNDSLNLPAAPPMLVARMSSESLAYSPNVVESPELDPSGQLADSIFVGASSSGSVEFPLVRHNWMHDVMAAVFRNEWGMGNLTGDSGGVFASRAAGANELIPGKNLIMYGVEKRYTTDDGDVFHYFDRVGVSTLSLRVAPQEIITGSIGLMGGVMTASEERVAVAATYADPGEYKPMTAPNVTEITIEGMVATQCFNSLTLNFASNLRGIPCIGQESDRTKGLGRFIPTIDGSTYFENNEHVDALVSQDALKVTIVLTDGDGNAYEFFYPRVKFTAAPVTTPGTNQDVMQAVSMRAHYAADYGYSVMVRRTLAP